LEGIDRKEVNEKGISKSENWREAEKTAKESHGSTIGC
jgi:hypothetical protein